MTTLDDKIRNSEAQLSNLLERAGAESVRVAWTGGKDSTVVLFIWKMLLDHAGLGNGRVINLDTGCKFPEVLAFRDRLTGEWGLELFVARPAVALEGYPLARDTLACCLELKVKPLQAAIAATGTTHLLTGIRRDEHPDRADRQAQEKRLTPPHVLVNPILDWTETDIWAFHARFDLPHCELYDRGYRSLGCRPCTARPEKGGPERSGRDRNKEQMLRSLTSLGYF
ncbi:MULTISPECIES: phosphoadenosine phosphosulfate reductase family protein [unclassified Pseudodesulfovibrio]|uniref:phosphoadenosine phosphosulfate reductase family protein n=1 Tax=unclassified Pseudodesulfovibrio TaxID=2661612 RepID=UPI000FEB944A|nr:MULTISPECIES: phosphoadenosine phosphosulfate reductase family protein [unclassified Pseudodesulfovibrio]MCJ2164470.1 phosphoadenosine phosphosulfate reductase family protein [Pseudodesulfovibrio sp. S3-i]RWU04670.1 phosphoadenosine phosphosulfate reductase [Pseudodesulfovibrio sp. S3]